MVDENSIFCGGLHKQTSNESLLQYFQPYGATRAVVKWDEATGNSRGFGFVTFQSSTAVNDALSIQHAVDGKAVECKVAAAKGIPMGGGGSTFQGGGGGFKGGGGGGGMPQMGLVYDSVRIFVGGLPQSCNDEMLAAVFAQFGTVMEAKVHMDQITNRSKGFAYISFDDPEAVESAIESGNEGILIDDKIVEVKRCEAKGQKTATFTPGGMGGKGGGDGGFWGKGGKGKGGGGGFQQQQQQPQKSIALQALQQLPQEQSLRIKGMMDLLQDPAAAETIRLVIDEVQGMKQGGGGGKGGPYGRYD